MFMNERKSGSSHVTAARAADANAAKIGSGSFVFNQGDKLALTVTPATGEAHVASGIMSWCGRICGVTNPESVSYAPPESETLFKKVLICAQYTKSTTDGIETISLIAFASDAVASESAAAALTIDTGTAEITEATETANLPLWSFVATSNSATVPVQLFAEVPSLAEIRDILADLTNGLNAETAERKAETEELSTAVDSLSKGIVTIATGLDGTGYSGTEKRTDYVAFILKFKNNEVMTIPSIPGTYTKYFYSVEDAGTLSSASKVTVGIRKLTLTTADTITLNYGVATNADVCEYVTTIYGIR